MNNIEIQRENILEVVGTQYEGRAVNHQGLSYQQKLVMQHQTDNPHDSNAVLILTEDGRELGYLSAGYASVYAPMIDSERYSFTIEVSKSEPDSNERPVLMVKIISEPKRDSEDEIENAVLVIVQDIVNGQAQSREEYLSFISTETVDTAKLF